MSFWTTGVEALAGAILAVGEALGGGRTVGILVTIFVIRCALIPLLAPLAIRTRDRQRVVRRIRPQIKALDRELRDHPSTLSKRLKALHQENGIQVVDWPGLGAALVQLPILIALFQAVLIVWEPVAFSLAAGGLGVLSGGFAVFGAKVSGQSEGATWLLWMSGLLPVAICLWLGVGVGLYLTGFYAGGALQSLLMGRGAPAGASAES